MSLFWAFLTMTKLQWASLPEQLWTTALFAICCLPLILYFYHPHFQIPLVPMWGFGYFTMFGMPMLSAEESWVDFSLIPKEAVTGALGLISLGACACLLTCYTPLGQWVETLTPRIRLPWEAHRAPKTGVLLTLVGLAIYHYRLTSTLIPELQQFLYIGAQFSTVGMLTLFLLQLRGGLSTKLKFFLWGFALPVQLVYSLGTGALWTVIRTVSPLMFCYTAERHRIPWKWSLVFTVCLIPFLGIKHEYRSYAWGGEGALADASPFERGVAFLQLTTERLAEGGVETYTVAAETAESRVNHLQLMIHTQEMTPYQVPYWRGETYQTLLWTFVPRFLYPNKPTKTLGNEFGHRYDIIAEEDTWTSINLPHQVIEMFVNFGTGGVLIGMALLGFVYRAILAFLSRPDAGERAIIIGCALLGNLLSLDSDFSLVFGGLLYYVLAMVAITRFLQPIEPLPPQVQAIHP